MTVVVDINLADRAAVYLAFAERRQQLGWGWGDWEERSGVSLSSLFAWRSGKRDFSIWGLAAAAGALGFDLVAVGPNGVERSFCRAADIATFAHEYRKRLGWTLTDLAERSGVSMSSELAIRAGRGRDSRLGTMVALAHAVDVRLVMRRADQSVGAALPTAQPLIA